MAKTRRFGPVAGAGVVIIEKSPENPIQVSSFGNCSIVGLFERGEISTATLPKLNPCVTKGEFTRRMGGRISSSTSPDVAQDFWDHGQGAGKLFAVRVTDGNESIAEITLYSRDWGTDFIAPDSSKDGAPQVKRAVLKIQAKNGGAWAGNFRIVTGDMVNPTTDLTETTLDTKITGVFKANEFTDGAIELLGPGKSYKVLSNTAAGVFTVEADSKMKSDFAAYGGTNETYSISLPYIGTFTSPPLKALAVRVKEGKTDTSNTFGLEVLVDGVVVKDYATLSMDPTSAFYAPTLINEDLSNFEIKVTDLWAGQGTVTPDIRPANFYGRLTTVTTTSVTVDAAQIKSVADANVRVVKPVFPVGGKTMPQKLTFTWDSTNNKYTVVATQTSAPRVLIQQLPDFTVGAGEQLNKTYTAANKYTFGVTIDHLGAVANATTFVLEFIPINPAFVAGAQLLPDAKSKPFNRFRVSSALGQTLTVESGDPSTIGTGSTSASVTSTNAETYNIVVSSSDTMKLQIDGRKVITVTLTPGAARTAAQVAADINSAFTALGLTPASAVSGKVVLTSPGGFSSGGPGSIVDIQTVANNAYTVLGFTVATTRGTAGTEAQLIMADELGGGFDGGAPADQKYLDALSISNSPLNQLEGENHGVVQIATPGVTSTTVQKQGLAYAEAKNHAYHVLIPATTTDEQGSINYINTTIGRSNYGQVYFPSFVNVTNPDKTSLTKQIPVTGMILGRDALFARDFQGYHRPAAGVDATLPRIVSLPTGDTKLNEEVLTPQGINVVKKRQGTFIIWGARTIYVDTAFQFKTHRLQLSHYEHVLQDNFDWVIFMLGDANTRAVLLSVLTTYFLAEFAKGTIVGNGPDDAAQIKLDAENNPDSSVAAGDMNAEIKLKLATFVERFIITVSKVGIFENTSAA